MYYAMSTNLLTGNNGMRHWVHPAELLLKRHIVYNVKVSVK